MADLDVSGLKPLHQRGSRLRNVSWGYTGDIQDDRQQLAPGDFHTNLPPVGDRSFEQQRELPPDRNTYHPNDISPHVFEDI